MLLVGFCANMRKRSSLPHRLSLYQPRANPDFPGAGGSGGGLPQETHQFVYCFDGKGVSGDVNARKSRFGDFTGGTVIEANDRQVIWHMVACF